MEIKNDGTLFYKLPFRDLNRFAIGPSFSSVGFIFCPFEFSSFAGSSSLVNFWLNMLSWLSVSIDSKFFFELSFSVDFTSTNLSVSCMFVMESVFSLTSLSNFGSNGSFF